MLAALEPEEERELQQIGRQSDVRNRGMAIQMPPLNTYLVEVHHELAKINREAKEIAEVCKRTTKESDQMHKEWSQSRTQTRKYQPDYRKSKQN